MSRRVGGIVLALAALGLLAVIVWVGRQPKGEQPSGEAATTEQEAPDSNATVEASGGELVHRDRNGRPVWSAKFGGTITLDEQRRRLRHTDVVWRLESDGRIDLSVRAPVMEADYDTRSLTFSDGVDVQARDGKARFVVDRLRYEFDTGKLISDGEVAFMYGGFALRGSRLVIDSRNDKVRVSNATLSFDRAGG
ncbi:MAG: LPS export ABC transporter periplasmic protein LptC [Armatimonadetes bacterium]|nr:LPS export ABC transporter periplasmic protein LptC [Armatimonadota bacterium]